MNSKIIVTKPLYVALAQRKEDRKAHLASQYIQRMAGMRVQGMQQMPGVQQMGMGGYLMPAAMAPPPTACTEVLRAWGTPSTTTKVAAAEHGCTLWRKSGHGHDWNADEHDARHDNGQRRCSFPGSKDGAAAAAGGGDGETRDIHDGQTG